jgi:hypothetical protein
VRLVSPPVRERTAFVVTVVLFESQASAGSSGCPGASGCDTAYGLGAALVGMIAALPLTVGVLTGRCSRLLAARRARS